MEEKSWQFDAARKAWKSQKFILMRLAAIKKKQIKILQEEIKELDKWRRHTPART